MKSILVFFHLLFSSHASVHLLGRPPEPFFFFFQLCDVPHNPLRTPTALFFHCPGPPPLPFFPRNLLHLFLFFIRCL